MTNHHVSHLAALAVCAFIGWNTTVVRAAETATTNHASPQFIVGADISWAQEQEDQGKQFSVDGVPRDLLQILREHGFNCIRLRLFVNPRGEHGYSVHGYCDLPHTLQMAKRIKAAGLGLLLDLHYSDTWADPAHQLKPAAWAGLHGRELEQAVHDYTRAVVAQFNAQGTPPDLIQIGNEISNGFLWPDGEVWKTKDWDGFCGLLKAGIAGARAAAPSAKIILHLACGGQNAQSRAWLDPVLAHGVAFDIIGQSYYPKWHGTLADLQANLTDLAGRYRQELMVVEYALPHVRQVNDIVRSLPNGKGRGTFIWEATRPGPDSQPLFDDNGHAKPELNDFQTLTTFPRGHILFHTDFAGKKLTVDKPSIVSFKLPTDQLRGYTIRGNALIKADNVTAKPNAWNGIKFMLVIDTPTGKQWPQADLGTGSFDWKRVTFTAKIPPDTTAVTLCLGLENVTGTVTFDDVTFIVAKPPLTAQPRIASGPPFKGHDLPRLRGVMIHPDITADSLRTLGRDWHANLIRWQLIRHDTTTDYDQWLAGELQKLDAALPVCQEVGLRVVVDLHSPPGGKKTSGGYLGTDSDFFTDKSCQQKFVAVWQRIAARYKDAKPIWGYDLANEPVETDIADDCDDWHDLAARAANAIRAIDASRAIICEAAPWGTPSSLAEFTPIAVSNVVYSVHMYEPGEFTHQGVFHRDAAPVNYPGIINGKQWDKASLEKVLQPVVDFQRRYNVHIYLGEFSAIRWAPGDSAYNYLKDCIEIFEAHGWDWTYHAFREWNGWSVEHGPDRADNKPAATPTPRERLLREWFAKNQKPRE